MSEEYAPSAFNPFTPGAPLEPFHQLLVRAEWCRSPESGHIRVRQYGGYFDEGETVLHVEMPGGKFDSAECETVLRTAGWAITGPWTRGDRGGLDAPVEAVER
ncbi:hypothetical protein [Streptomyces sp. NPDC101206]|uniref:hypothetical protein n=1 Tax=Streptomyces sp. NPDC101206 TaxID=3366128 RepID=UPI003810B9F2